MYLVSGPDQLITTKPQCLARSQQLSPQQLLLLLRYKPRPESYIKTTQYTQKKDQQKTKFVKHKLSQTIYLAKHGYETIKIWNACISRRKKNCRKLLKESRPYKIKIDFQIESFH